MTIKDRKFSMSDQLPLVIYSRFSALPTIQNDFNFKSNKELSLFLPMLYVINTFGIFPFITLPSLLVEMGIFGIPLVLSVVAMQMYTSFLLSQCWSMAESFDSSLKSRERTPYIALADIAYGKHLSRLVKVLLYLSIFATSIPNIVVAADSLHLAGARFTTGSFNISYCYMVLGVGAFIVVLMLIGNPKNIRILAVISVCVVIILVLLLWVCLLSSMTSGMTPFEGVTFDYPYLTTILNGYSVLAFQFDIHPMFLTLKIDMERKSMVGCSAFSAVTVITVVAICGSTLAAYKFGSTVSENILETLPRSGFLEVLLILMAVYLSFSTAVGSFSMFQQIDTFFKINEGFSLKRWLIRIIVVILEILMAEIMPKFDSVMEIVGGTIIGPLIFIIPPLLYRRIRQMEQNHQKLAVEATYGSIPLDLYYDATEIDTEVSSKRRWIYKLFKYINICNGWECHKTFSTAILIFGIFATFLSTFLNYFRLDEIIENNIPCYTKNSTF